MARCLCAGCYIWTMKDFRHAVSTVSHHTLQLHKGCIANPSRDTVTHSVAMLNALSVSMCVCAHVHLERGGCDVVKVHQVDVNLFHCVTQIENRSYDFI